MNHGRDKLIIYFYVLGHSSRFNQQILIRFCQSRFFIVRIHLVKGSAPRKFICRRLVATKVGAREPKFRKFHEKIRFRDVWGPKNTQGSCADAQCQNNTNLLQPVQCTGRGAKHSLPKISKISTFSSKKRARI